MSDPAACIDLASTLRGLGAKTSKYGGLVQAQGEYCPPRMLSSVMPTAVHRPGIDRDPHGAIGGRMMTASSWVPGVVDDRDIRQVIGTSSRMDGRGSLVVRR